jgi:hypothetical protein
MAPRPQIIGQSAHAPEGPDDAGSVTPIAQPSMDQPSMDEAQAGTPGKPGTMGEPAPAVRLDPTRYGDWERNGRCIDF